ncbi:MAG: helix-turn-helix domain-containing protein [Spirochaetales bacterium]|nr:helix-turn-helix domain-containing protein [Spirochaetales bacterium]
MRIGFVLAELSTGSSLSMWPSVASMFPSDVDDTLVVFSGGRLNSPNPLESMRNSIYRFVNPDNLEGAIIWSSSLTGSAKSKDVMAAFKSMLSLPMVTIDGKTQEYPEIPDVRFDAYDGSRQIVEHCIRHHNATRIAYIRGPENHNSAQERFQAYLDALKSHGIHADKTLISDPMPWDAGDEAVRQLVEKRKKVPGKDFNYLLCASDLMLYKASLELMKHGYEIGQDLHVCGFNDSLESRLLKTPVTTVRLPYAGLGVSSVLSFKTVAEGKWCGDRVLPTRPMFRRSCGCGLDFTGERLSEELGIVEYITGHFPISANESRNIVNSVLKSPTESNLRHLLERLCQCGADVFEIFDILRILDNQIESDDNRHLKLREIASYLLPSVLDRNDSIRRYEERSIRRAFGALSNEMLEANKVSEIADILKSRSASLGFEQIHLVIQYDDMSYLVEKGQMFPGSLLVPEGKNKLLDSGTWVVAPLCTETESMGYLIMKPTVMNGQVCEDIRSTVSSAMRSVLLFEMTRRAKQAAENAEQARTNFFANVGENLRNPLTEISKIMSASDLDSDTKKAVIDRINGVNNMIDLALGTTGELELNRYIEDIDSILSSYDCYEKTMPLPYLLVDKSRIRQAIGSIVSSIESGALIQARIQRRGVRIDISDRTGKWQGPKDDPAVALARQIIILHEGVYSVGKESFSIILPFPTISGNTPAVWESGKKLAWIGKKPPFPVSDAEIEEGGGKKFTEKKRLPADAGAIYWDSGFRGYNALNGLLALSSNEVYRDMPVLCMDVPRSRTLEDALRASLEEKGKVILQIGQAPEELFRWIQEPEVISADMGNAVFMAKRHEPELVILALEDLEDSTQAAMKLISELRGLKRMSQTPIIISSEYLDFTIIEAIGGIPNIIAANTCILESEEFAMRVRAILSGSEPLATNTAVIVKKAQLYICSHATLPLSRWQIAEDVHVSEDYLTRVFKKELGLAPWDYLNRYRVWLAGTLLRNTGMSVYDVAEATGFQDQAYFCRVFKKIRGYSPSRLRSIKSRNCTKNSSINQKAAPIN